MQFQPLRSVARRNILPSQLRAHYSSMAPNPQPKFSHGEDEGSLEAQTAALLQSKWTLDETQQGLEKTFSFPTYAKALVSQTAPYRNVAEIYPGLHTAYRGGNQVAKSPP